MRVVVAAVFVVLLVGATTVAELQRRWRLPLSIPDQGFVLTIAQGQTLSSVAETLHTSGILANPELMTLYGRWTGLDQQIKRGEYLLMPVLTLRALLALLTKGDVIAYQVTLPEGITLAAALEILAQQKQLNSVLQGTDDPRILQLIEPQASAEGLFFPDSYRYVRGDTDWSILQRAHQAMATVLQDEWLDRADNLPYQTPYEALIMASIIERETGLSTEREKIAGVFVRRLHKGMLLQTDPTVIYGLGDQFDGNLRRRDLRGQDNPYNTYRHAGLPPGPIALPGKAAIRAAMHPDATNTLYFVARGDGGHVFSETLAEHNRAVRAYQLQRKKNYRSSPASTP